jgi:esterase/lipase superfamily enzyme
MQQNLSHTHIGGAMPARVLFCMIAACLAVYSGGCGGGPSLVATPNLYTQGGPHPFGNVPEDLQNNRVELFYATDRVPEVQEDGTIHYGYGRSQSLAIGNCTVTIGEDLGWPELVEVSTSKTRPKDLPLAVARIDEWVRFPSSSTPLIKVDGEFVVDPAIQEAADIAKIKAMGLLEERLAASERKEIYVFIHGYNNSFEAAAFRMAQLWHFMGRQGVPIIYTWPAGRGGVLRGYTYDRESSEFTIHHLRQFLKAIAQTPGLEKIHIIAHSRGTDVAVTGLREFHLENSGTGVDTRTRMKLGNLILAAPDLDWEVAQQRISAERILQVPEHVAFYLSKEDRAIGIAGWLFASVQRIGRLAVGNLTEAQQRAVENFPEMDIIEVKVDVDFVGHGYFINNPAVLSDLILILRDGRDAGTKHGRPLSRENGGFWTLENGYPNQTGEDN